MRRPPFRKIAGLLALAHLPSIAATQLAAPRLEELSLEQLTEIRVTSVSRREERLADAPAAIFVITADDIRRAGATRLEEALRLAPNLQVMRTNANDYIVGARGFNATVSNKMLVMIDGRTIYSPLFSGVFWDAQAIAVEEIERIEVISGPAGTLWGSNGVNGVVSITTRDAASTHRTAVAASAGNVDRHLYARQGWHAGAGDYRLFARYFEGDARTLERGGDAHDSTRRAYVGLRGDVPLAQARGMVEAVAARGDSDRIQGDRDFSAAHVLGRWEGRDSSAPRLQVYWDHTTRVQRPQFEETLDIFDVDYQALAQPAPGQSVVWGAGYRAARDRTRTLGGLVFLPQSKFMPWGNAFVEDQVRLSPAWSVTLGVKAESNPYTGVEWLPSTRLAYEASPEHLLWAALSRAVRAPSRLDRELAVPGVPPFTVLEPNADFRSEVANVAEIGYRSDWGRRLRLSFSVFLQDYPNLRSVEPGTTSVVFANGLRARETGVTGWFEYAPRAWWRVSAGFDALRERFSVRPGYRALGGASSVANDPAYTAQVRTQLDLFRGIELDLAARHVAALPDPRVPAYTAVDARVGYRWSKDLELALAAQDALDRRYAEFGDPALRSRFGREYRLIVRWQL